MSLRLTILRRTKIIPPTASIFNAFSSQRPFSTMSWMDSWSRPSANSKVPPPLYLSNDNVPYCHTCGRVMSSKKPSANNTIKYCSSKCRSRKPGPLDKRIENTIVSLLEGEIESGVERAPAKKGDPRILVTCDEVETSVFGSRFDPEKVYGRRKNRKSRAIGDPNAEWKSVDMEDSEPDENGQIDKSDENDENDDDKSMQSEESGGGVRIRPPQAESEVNFSVGGERGKAEKIEESADDLEKRRQGAKRAEEREMVRRAARRGIVFGFEVPKKQATATKGKTKGRRRDDSDPEEEATNTELRKAEAMMNGMVVEPSFAKGNWAIRWRE